MHLLAIMPAKDVLKVLNSWKYTVDEKHTANKFVL